MVLAMTLAYPGNGASRASLAAFALLSRPVWVVDTTALLPWYANPEALRLWQAPSLEALVARAGTMLPPRLNELLEQGRPALGDGRPAREMMTLPVDGRPVLLECLVSPLTIEGGREGLLVEAAPAAVAPLPEPVTRVASLALNRAPMLVTMFNGLGEAIYHNEAAASAFCGSAGPGGPGGPGGCSNPGALVSFSQRFADPAEAAHAWEAVRRGRVYRAESPMPTLDGPRWMATEIRMIREAAAGGGPTDDRALVPVIDSLAPSPPLYSDGDDVMVLMTARDVTEQVMGQQSLRETVERLARSNTELEQFAWITSHDLREPLRTVISYLNLLKRHLRDQLDGTGNDFMNFAIAGARRMDDLTRDLQEYASIGRSPLPMQQVDLNEVMERVLRHWQTALTDCGGLLQYGTLPVVLGDSGELVKLFVNLVGNSIKYRRPDVPLRISILSEPEGKAWMIAVIDNGEGIDPSFSERIFQIFQRLRVQDSEGTGVGLALCRKIVERHGGRIWVESQAGKGAAFFLTLPRS